MNGHHPSEAEIFERAAELSGEARAAYLAQACAANDQLRKRVESLLVSHQDAEAGAFMDKAPVASAKTLVITPSMIPVTDQPGEKIGAYKLLQQIGEGGMGSVWMAERQQPFLRVALKLVKLGMDSKQVVARFHAEQEAMARMDHPNIAKVHDAGVTDNGRPYFVMELVRGIPITDYCDKERLSTQERLNLLIQVCQAIQHAHQKGVIHRDIKPSNILVTMLDGEPVPKVIDFGIAKATQGKLIDETLFTAFEQFIGTPAYMSPEQAEMNALDIDTRSDIYSLGVLLYELLSGKTPFDTKKLLEAGLDEIRRIIREVEPPRPSTRLSSLEAAEQTTVANQRHSEPPKLLGIIRGDLDWIVMKALEKDRRRRYETANGLAMDIQRHLTDEPVIARPPSKLYRFQRMVRRNKVAFVGTCAVTASLLLGIGFSTWSWVQEKEARRRAVAAERDQSAQRKLAELAEQNARVEAKRAEAATTETKAALSRAHFLHANRMIEDSDWNDALAYLAASISANTNNRAALTRLVTALMYRRWRLPEFEWQHNGPVTHVDISPDGKRFLAVSHEELAEERILSFFGIRRGIGNATVCVWDAVTGREWLEPLKLVGPALLARFSPDGRSILTQSTNQTARLWDAATAKPLTPPLITRSGILQFSPDGTRLVTDTATNAFTIWSATSGQALVGPVECEGSIQAIHSAKFSPDGNLILTLSTSLAQKQTVVQLWDSHTGGQATEAIRLDSIGIAAEFSPVGGRLVTTGKAGQMWDTRTGKPIGKRLGSDSFISSVQFSPDGRRILTSGRNGIQVWDTNTGELVCGPLTHTGPSALGLLGTGHLPQFTSDGRHIVKVSLSGRLDFGRQGGAWIWDAQTGQLNENSVKLGTEVICAQFSPDSSKLITGSIRGMSRLLKVPACESKPLTFGHEKTLNTADFSRDGRRVVTGSDDMTARVWDASNGCPLTDPLTNGALVWSAQFSPDGKQLVTATRRGTARIWEADTGRLLAETPEETNFWSFGFSPDLRRLVTGSLNGKVQILDTLSREPLSEPQTHARGMVTLASFSTDGSRILTISHTDASGFVKGFGGRGRGTMRIWDAATGNPLTEPLEHGGSLTSAGLSPDGQQIVTGSRDYTAQVWDVKSGKLASPIMHHGNFVWSAEFSGDGTRVLTASADGKAQIWDIETGLPASEPFEHERGTSPYSARFSADGKRIVTAAHDGKARIWDIGPSQKPTPNWLIPLVEAICGRVVNEQGVMTDSETKRAETIREIRRGLEQSSSSDDWTTWGRWFLAEPSTRTISPFSKLTVSERIENLIKENTSDSLVEAEQLAFGNTDVTERVIRLKNELQNINQGGNDSKAANKTD